MDIIGIDQPCLDHLILVDHIPQADTQLNMERQSWQGGGRVPTALAAAARLGAKTGLIGWAGDDRTGRYLKSSLAEEGVDVAHLCLQQGRHTDYVVALAERATHGRAFMARPGDCAPLTPAGVPVQYVSEARAILLYRFDAADVFAAQTARRAGVTVACDCDDDEYFEPLMANIGLIDVFIASEFAYRRLFPDGGDPAAHCREIRQLGPSTVIFTLGSRGCMGLEEDGSFFTLPACKVAVTDTTGAGDTFHGAWLYFHVNEGLGIREAARHASAVSAIQCMHLGGRAGLPTREMAEAFLQNGSFDRTPLLEREARCAELPL